VLADDSRTDLQRVISLVATSNITPAIDDPSRGRP
jgi:hypothetical protein